MLSLVAYDGIGGPMFGESIKRIGIQGLAPTIELTAQDAIPQHMSEIMHEAKEVIRKARSPRSGVRGGLREGKMMKDVTQL